MNALPKSEIHKTRIEPITAVWIDPDPAPYEGGSHLIRTPADRRPAKLSQDVIPRLLKRPGDRQRDGPSPPHRFAAGDGAMVNLLPSVRSPAALAEVFMPNGTPVNRDWVYVLQDGTVVIEWEEGNLQDIQTGDFLHQGAFGHPVQDSELEQLRLTGRVEKFDVRTVYLRALPDFKRKTIE